MNSRAQTNLLSYVLIFAVVSTAVGILMLSGTISLGDLRSDARIDNAERAMEVLSNSMEDVYYRQAPSRAVEIKLSESAMDVGGTTEMQVVVGGTRSGTSVSGGTQVYPASGTFRQSERLNFSLDDGYVTYAWGAVLKHHGGTVPSEDPPMSFSSSTVVLNPVVLNGSDSYGSSDSSILVIADLENSTVKHQEEFGSTSTVWVKVRTSSELARGWNEYFEDRGVGTVYVDVPNGEVLYEVDTDSLVVRETWIEMGLES